MPKRSSSPAVATSRPIFLSHADVDKELADAILTLLAVAMEIKVTNYVFCSSAYGCGLTPGDKFVEVIKANISEPKIVLILATQNYIVSEFCWVEAGAAWIKSHKVIVFAVEPLKRSGLPAVLNGIQSGNLVDPDYWNLVLQEFQDTLKIEINFARWERKRDESLEKIAELIKKQPSPKVIPLAEHKKLEAKLATANSDLKKLEAEIERLLKVNEQLENTRPAKTVAQINLKSLPENKQFKKLVEQVQETFRSIPRVCENALFENLSNRNLDWSSDDVSENNEIRAAIKKKHLIDDEERGVSVNDTDPKMGRAIDALNELSRFLDTASLKFKESYIEEYDHEPLISSEQFWDEHLR